MSDCLVQSNHVAGFQHADLGAGKREHVGRDSAARARAHNDDVVCFRCCFDLGHILICGQFIKAARGYLRLAIYRSKRAGERRRYF